MKKTFALVPLAAVAVAVAVATPAGATTVPGPSNPNYGLAVVTGGSTHAKGAGVNMYAIGGPINTAGAEFGGRAKVAYDPNNTSTSCANEDEHDTGVADVMAGAVNGVAPQANIWVVDAETVAECNAAGSSPQDADMVAAVNWLTANHLPNAVANISWNNNGVGYFGWDQDITTAVDNLAASGVFITVSAGDQYNGEAGWGISANQACDNSPANAAQALVVASTDWSNQWVDNQTENTTGGGTWTWTSAMDNCVSLFAPGAQVAADGLQGTPQLASGTSFSAPYGAGVAALYKSSYGDASSATVKTWILNHAKSGLISNDPSGTPNLLLSSGGL